MNKKNQELFVVALEQHSQVTKYNTQVRGNSAGTEGVCNSMMIPLIHKDLEVCKISQPKKEASNTFPTNPWYNEECKAAKRLLKKETNSETLKKYKNLIKTKKESYVAARRNKLISLGKYNPKGFWREL